MKKIMYILLIAALASGVSACDDDDKPLEYLSPDIIAGKWYNINLADSTVRTFQNEYATASVYNRYTGELRANESYGKYKLTELQVFFEVYRNGMDYRTNVDSLWISEGNRRMVKYQRVQ